ncbi:MAG: hypothetical protein VX015_07290 [Planctomycetota bacterium]|nr:hypothetical protein [Planctomycetota bacterium]
MTDPSRVRRRPERADAEGDRRPGGTPCTGCQHLYTTWRPRRPRGCAAYGFESRTWPSLVVEQTSGAPCELFAPRPASGAAKAPADTTPPHRSRRPGGLYG